MTLVVGATGMLGGEICQQLLAHGLPVRAMVRTTSDPVKVSTLRSMGAEIVQGDLRDPLSLRRACSGMQTVISTATSLGSFAPENSFINSDLAAKDLIDAARAARVDQFIYTSVSRNLNPDCDLTFAKRAVEQHLLASGLTYTILRASAFMEIWLSPPLGFDAVRGRAQVIGAGDQPLSYISLVDVAQFAVASVGNPVAANSILELGGPEAITPLDVIKVFEELSGKTFEVTHIPLDALRAQHAAADNALSKTFAALMLAVAGGDVIPMQDMQRRFPQVTLKSIRAFAAQTIGVPAAV
jgi:NADH dehydrogenase